ncbi:hypothetical protein J4486_005637 [Salmonella enterica]|nr:hypothetical protein [Salmonella enterica]EHG4046991.1 hypothetical protein [Salmonella enterica]
MKSVSHPRHFHPGTLKPPVMAVAGFCSSGVVLSGWSVVALAGFWLAAYVVALSGGLPARQISPDSVRFH